MDRWWNAGNTAVEALELVDGSSPRLGVGVAVLGFHAIAKSALDPLAETTLVDQLALQSAIEKADYEPVLEAVHTATCDALGHEAAAKYGELVVNDLRQRTSDSARRLYQTLVNKGVPSPRAVVRVASVAGVPIEYLGRYATIASNAGLDALSVADHADRALMEFASRRSALEPELVRKDDEGRQRQRHRAAEPWDEAEHPRDEIGRFSQVQAGDEERRERAARRARRKRRKERKLQMAQRSQEIQAVQERKAVVEGPEERKRTDTSPQARTIADRDAGQRKITYSSKGVYGLAMLPLDEVPMAEENNGSPVTVSEPVYLIDPDPFGSELGLAYTEETLQRALVHAVALQDGNSVVVRRFAAGQLPVLGTIEAKLPGKYGPKVEGLSPVLHPVDQPFVTVSAGDEKRLVNWFGATELLNRRGEVAVVRFYDALLKGSGKDVPTSKSDEEGRQRQYQRQTEVKWDEAEHPRDEIGRFTESNESERDKEDRRRRRERRKKRRERKQRMAQRAQEAQDARAQSAERPAENVSQQRKTVERITQQRKTVERDSQRRKIVERQAGATVESLEDFVDDVGALFATVSGSNTGYKLLGMGNRPDGTLDLLDFYNQAMSAAATCSQAEEDAVYRLHEAMINSGQLSFEEAYAAVQLHSAIGAVLRKGSNAVKEHKTPQVMRADIAEELAWEVGHEMLIQGNSVNTLLSGSRVEYLEDEEAKKFAELHESGLDIVTPAVKFMNRDSDEVRYVTTPDTNFGNPNRTITIISNGAYSVLEDLHLLTAGRGSTDTDFTYRTYSSRRSRTKLLTELRSDDPTVNGLDLPGATLGTVISELLKQDPVFVTKMPPTLKPEIAEQALINSPSATVRLDGIDVFKITQGD